VGWLLMSLRVAGPLIVWVIHIIRDIDEQRWQEKNPTRDLNERHVRWLDSPQTAAKLIAEHARRRRKRRGRML
jgi:hypothetical protein